MAGQSRQALRTRIKSVQSTRKITKAMEMIANAKLVRSRRSGKTILYDLDDEHVKTIIATGKEHIEEK